MRIDSDNRKQMHVGCKVFGFMMITFIILKLLGYISWSWGCVLAPIWMPLAIFVIFVIIAWIIEDIL